MTDFVRDIIKPTFLIIFTFANVYMLLLVMTWNDKTHKIQRTFLNH
jgi:hypothetical protein